ncbi:hypothetical protein MKX03_019278 [Papaver bracteatum]|nr:hypothetical protein MKX03_019278 [Papaver bracteatum]
MGSGKRPKTKKTRKPTMIKPNIYILDFDVANVTPLATIGASGIDTSTTSTPTLDANTSVTLEEIFLGENETVTDEGMGNVPITSSANLLDANKISPPITNTDS